MTDKELIELSNSLNNNDLMRLVQMNSNRFSVFVERHDGNHCETLCDVVPVCMNGNSIQINIKESLSLWAGYLL